MATFAFGGVPVRRTKRRGLLEAGRGEVADGCATSSTGSDRRMLPPCYLPCVCASPRVRMNTMTRHLRRWQNKGHKQSSLRRRKRCKLGRLVTGFMSQLDRAPRTIWFFGTSPPRRRPQRVNSLVRGEGARAAARLVLFLARFLPHTLVLFASIFWGCSGPPSALPLLPPLWSERFEIAFQAY